MLENTKINNVDFTGLPVKERIYEWDMFGSVIGYTKCEVVAITSVPEKEQSSYSSGECVSVKEVESVHDLEEREWASLSEEVQSVHDVVDKEWASLSEEGQSFYGVEDREWASVSEEGQMASSLEEEYRVYSYKAGLFITPYKEACHTDPLEENCQQLDRKESRKAKFIEQRPSHIKHKRHSSIKTRYLVDQEILKEIKLVHKYLELDRQESILKANRLKLYKESKENKEENNVERFVDNFFLQSTNDDYSTNQPKSSKSKARNEEVSDIPEYRQIKAVETVKKKKGFFCRVFSCLTL